VHFNDKMSSTHAYRAPDWCHQAPVRQPEGALHGDRKERRAGVLDDRFDQSLSGEASLDEL